MGTETNTSLYENYSIYMGNKEDIHHGDYEQVDAGDYQVQRAANFILITVWMCLCMFLCFALLRHANYKGAGECEMTAHYTAGFTTFVAWTALGASITEALTPTLENLTLEMRYEKTYDMNIVYVFAAISGACALYWIGLWIWRKTCSANKPLDL